MESTEVCENCKRAIPSVNYVIHLAHCSRNLEICSDCDEPVHIDNKDKHKKENHETIKCGLCGEDVTRPAMQEHIKNACLDRLIQCATCGIDVRFKQLDEHEMYCLSRTEYCKLCQKYVMIKHLSDHKCELHNQEEGKVEIPCEVCGQQVDITELETHQSTCTPTNEDHIQVINEPTSRCTRRFSTNEDNHYESGEETSYCNHDNEEIYHLPCEFCNELFPSDQLFAHQLECIDSDDDDDNNYDHDPEYYNNGERRPGRVPTGPGIDTYMIHRTLVRVLHI